ncbi:MAG: acyl-[acyl-carrier-protein] thioesterase [Acidimicrobiales bacterium]
MSDARTLVGRPVAGRTYRGERTVRLGDVNARARLRLDALARYLQDVANDDATDALEGDAMAWVVRSTTVSVERWPVFREPVALTTWGSGVGSRWAERRTSVMGERGGAIEVASTWIHVDLDSGRPKKLIPRFLDVYGEAIAGRQVPARLLHPTPPGDADVVPWTVRQADIDLLGHVNNAVYWAMVEEHLALHAPFTASVEYGGGVDHGQPVELRRTPGWLWVIVDGSVAASATVRSSIDP